MPEVINAAEAYVGRWTCSHCDRVELDQRGPLAVGWTGRPRDMEATESGELLVRSELAPILEASGCGPTPSTGATG